MTFPGLSVRELDQFTLQFGLQAASSTSAGLAVLVETWCHLSVSWRSLDSRMTVDAFTSGIAALSRPVQCMASMWPRASHRVGAITSASMLAIAALTLMGL